MSGDGRDPADVSPEAKQSVQDYLATLDDAAFGAAIDLTSKFVSPSDAARRTGALRGLAFFAYAINDLVDTDSAIIVDVEATRAIHQAEVVTARTVIEWIMDRFGLYPKPLAGTAPVALPKCMVGCWRSKG